MPVHNLKDKGARKGHCNRPHIEALQSITPSPNTYLAHERTLADHQNSPATAFPTSSPKPSALAQGEFLLGITLSEMVRIASMDEENRDFAQDAKHRFDQSVHHFLSCLLIRRWQFKVRARPSWKLHGDLEPVQTVRKLSRCEDLLQLRSSQVPVLGDEGMLTVCPHIDY